MIRRILRFAFLMVVLPVCVVFPLTGAFIAMFLVAGLGIALSPVWLWMSGRGWSAVKAREDLAEWWGMLVYPLVWAWHGDREGANGASAHV